MKLNDTMKEREIQRMYECLSLYEANIGHRKTEEGDLDEAR